MMLSRVKPIFAKLHKLQSDLDGAQQKMKSLENKRQVKTDIQHIYHKYCCISGHSLMVGFDEEVS